MGGKNIEPSFKNKMFGIVYTIACWQIGTTEQILPPSPNKQSLVTV